MAAPETVVSIPDKFAGFSEQWSPKIVGEINDLHLKAVRLHGEFVWHRHDDTDEFFLVKSGRLTIRLGGGEEVTIGPWEFFIVPRGVEHCPVAEEECEVLLLEPVGTPNTGDATDSERTAPPEWI